MSVRTQRAAGRRGTSRARVAVAAAVLAAGGLTLALGTPAGAAPEASCSTWTIQTSGGKAQVTECNTGSGTTVQGFVQDTDADGQCAYAYTTLNLDGVVRDQAKACPKGTVTYFDWSYPGYAPGQVQEYLREG